MGVSVKTFTTMKSFIFLALSLSLTAAFNPTAPAAMRQYSADLGVQRYPPSSHHRMAASVPSLALSRRGLLGAASAVAAGLAVSPVPERAMAATSGLYKDVEIAIDKEQTIDPRDMPANYKDAGEVAQNKGKYTNLLIALLVIFFVVPMAQYFWYVKDD